VISSDPDTSPWDCRYELSLRAVAERFERPINAVVRIEKGIVHDPELIAAYDNWLTQQEQARSAA
jgi:hypothetical protein